MNSELLYRFFEGKASEEEIADVKAWTEKSNENLMAFRNERKRFNAMLLMCEFSKEEKKNARHHILWNIFKAACIVVVTAGVTIGLFSISNKDNVNTGMQSVIVPAGQRVNIVLPDGTDVWLNAGTRMDYPLSFMKSKREIILDGEAYFDVVKNDKAPFVVHTRKADVEVLGTRFNVRSTSKWNDFETSLIAGKVKVIPVENRREIVLNPSQKAVYEKGQWNVSIITDFDTYRWREGLYCFHDKTFGEILNDMEYYYDVNIITDRKKLLGEVLSGKFRIADGLDYALNVLRYSIDFNYRHDRERNIIYIN